MGRMGVGVSKHQLFSHPSPLLLGNFFCTTALSDSESLLNKDGKLSESRDMQRSGEFIQRHIIRSWQFKAT